MKVLRKILNGSCRSGNRVSFKQYVYSLQMRYRIKVRIKLERFIDWFFFREAKDDVDSLSNLFFIASHLPK